ncbi:hypothetical protein Ciccas_013407, partial [Cichlidogyrus casuarinus]
MIILPCRYWMINARFLALLTGFIRRRHPQLKTGSINLCMTDVCVQARRVSNNQRNRVQPAGLNGFRDTSSTQSPPPLSTELRMVTTTSPFKAMGTGVDSSFCETEEEEQSMEHGATSIEPEEVHESVPK